MTYMLKLNSDFALNSIKQQLRNDMTDRVPNKLKQNQKKERIDSNEHNFNQTNLPVQQLQMDKFQTFLTNPSF